MIRPQVIAQIDKLITLFQRRVGLCRGDGLRFFLLFILLLLFLALFSAGTAAAQEGVAQPDVQQMKLQILPEYDDPRILVIAQGRLDVASGVYNGPITFRLPAEAQINQMAVLNLDLGGPESISFETQPDPDDPAWTLVTYTLTNPHFFFEYYYPLPGSGSQKQFSFVLNPYHVVQTLSVEIQEPLKAESFTLEPAAATSRNDSAGFTYWLYPDRTVELGEEVRVQTRYTKTDPNPSVVREGETILQPGNNGENAAAPQVVDVPSTGLGISLIGIIVVIVIWFLRHRIRPYEAQSVLSAAAVQKRATEIQPLVIAESGQARFCTNCGQTLESKANFCQHCGTRARR
jgi:hypothetical protein